jgi:hypothetical protein
MTAEEVGQVFSNNFQSASELDQYIKLMWAFLKIKGAEANQRLAEGQANSAREQANAIIQAATSAANTAQSEFDALAAQLAAEG